MPWVLNTIYSFLILAVSPLLLYRCVYHGKYRKGWQEKLLGRLPLRESAAPCVWFHAVSVGEVLQLKPVIERLFARRPDCQIVISTTTSTGHDVAQATFPGHTVCYFPLDFSWAVSQALARVRPSAVILVELEIWPNFILAAAKCGIPLGLINGRVSERSFRGYHRIRRLMAMLLRRFDFIAAQNEDYAGRLQQLGAPPERLHVTGSIKFDRIETDRHNPQTSKLRQLLQIDEHEQVFVAGSTQSPEEEIALKAWQSVQTEFPNLRLILVPRHKERFDEVAGLLSMQNVPFVRRSQMPAGHTPTVAQQLYRARKNRLKAVDDIAAATQHRTASPTYEPAASRPVILLDTLGELGACWGLADIAFVGGSLTNRGGQNMIEPAAYGAALLFGPNTRNFQEVVDALLASDAAHVVNDCATLTEAIRERLRQSELAQRQGHAAQKFVVSQQGATERTLAHLGELLPEAPTTDDSARQAA